MPEQISTPPAVNVPPVEQSRPKSWMDNRFFAGLAIAAITAAATAIITTYLTIQELRSKTETIDDLRVQFQRIDSSVSLLVQEANDSIVEVDMLRTKVNGAEVTNAKYETAINSIFAKLVTLEQDQKTACSTIADLRERLARLEAQGEKSSP